MGSVIRKCFSNTTLFLILIILFCALIMQLRVKEGFSFSQCRNKGFSKEFCLQTPVSFGGPTVCRTPDGHIGQILPGFGGQCVTPPYVSPYFSV